MSHFCFADKLIMARANRLCAKKGTLPPSVVPQTDSSQPNASTTHSIGGRSLGTLGTSIGLNTPIPPSSSAIEVAGEETESTARTQPYSPKPHTTKPPSKGKKIAEGPSEPKKRQRKNCSKDSRSSRSSKWSQAPSKKRKVKEAAEEAESLKLISKVIECQNSILNPFVGQDSWELYQSCLLPRDQVVLAPTAYTHVEEHHAHALTQAIAFRHNPSLKCTYGQKEKFVADAKLAQSEASRLAAEEKIK
ncbi:hypothetical protein Salat_2125900 [Sesamum alatum]|uniref:Uncharacterized protein n=1 Tax=Sesamum alatum TaxID=300844 RepID=A0AAE1Y285_9LAMI|nr:hypothetical protein Salat_2125900 [Sesamum alatum]